MSAPRLLKAWREDTAQITQGKAAKQLGVSQPTWSDYEHGRKVPRTRVAVKIAAMTGGAVPVESWGLEDVADSPDPEAA